MVIFKVLRGMVKKEMSKIKNPFPALPWGFIVTPNASLQLTHFTLPLETGLPQFGQNIIPPLFLAQLRAALIAKF
jgi:hypothetical protein